jgi:Putative zinc-finger
MMSNFNDHCDFSETLVSYLYGEIGAAESDKFKGHLAQCPHCAEELAGFGVLRSQVAEWRQEEFAPMTSPAIELPLAQPIKQWVKKSPIIITEDPLSPPSSLLDSIRAFFTPPVMIGAAGFAAVLLCLGLIFTFMSSQNSPNFGDKNLVASNAPVKENKPVKIENPEPEKVNDVAKTVTPVPKQIESAAPVKAATKATKPVREYADYQIKNNVAGRAKPQNTPRQLKQPDTYLDTELYKETEDDSLRLADLFGEAGTE